MTNKWDVSCDINNNGGILGFEVSAFDSLVVAVMDIGLNVT
jgi:hypothetical protein